MKRTINPQLCTVLLSLSEKLILESVKLIQLSLVVEEVTLQCGDFGLNMISFPFVHTWRRHLWTSCLPLIGAISQDFSVWDIHLCLLPFPCFCCFSIFGIVSEKWYSVVNLDVTPLEEAVSVTVDKEKVVINLRQYLLLPGWKFSPCPSNFL